MDNWFRATELYVFPDVLSPGGSLVKTKLNSLRTQFRAELKRMSAAMRSGASAEDVPPKWKHYNSFLFLKDTMLETAPSESNVDEGNNEAMAAEEASNESTATILTSTPEPKETKKSRKRSARGQADKDALMSTAYPKLMELEPEDDEVDLFGKMVAKELRQLSPYQQSLAKLEIQTLLHRIRFDVRSTNPTPAPGPSSSLSNYSYSSAPSSIVSQAQYDIAESVGFSYANLQSNRSI